MTHILKNKKGVTLIELLAVVVILGIIAAIAVPTIGGLIARQEERAAEATYDALVSAAQLYADDENVEEFTLDDLDPDWLDLKADTNVFGFAADEDLALNAVFITVDGNGVLTFYSAYTDDVTNTPEADFFINGYNVTD